VHEKYFSLGLETSWANAAFCIFLAVLTVVWRSVKAKKFSANGWDASAIAWNVATWILGIPLAIWFPFAFGLIIIGAILSMTRREGYPVSRLAISLALATIIPIAFGVFLLKTFSDTIEMSEDRIRQVLPTRVQDVPKKLLRVDATGSALWLRNRKTYTWTTFCEDKFGPTWMGDEVFVGPTGVIRGDDLGKRIAEWAGVKIDYRWLKQ
jgi:hypothetical protein